MIIKVQISLASNGPESVLIYNEDRSFKEIISDPDMVATFKNVLDGEPKAFFNAEIRPGGNLFINSAAEWQEW